ncbi:MAG: DUF4112 domain-containing protein [Proteobacteria bacterium]|nr:DUF4112 domain-containing protein [Pseudomonadota bacterium]
MARARKSASEIERRIRRVERLARLLDRQFGVPGTKYRVGIDGLLGLIPLAGDLAVAVLALGLVAEAWRIGAPKRVLAPMIGTVLIDTTVGILPFVGDLFDFMFKANTRNALRLRAWWEKDKIVRQDKP